MRTNRRQPCVVVHGGGRRHPVIGRARRDQKPTVDRANRDGAFLGTLAGKHKTDLGTVGCRLPVGGVVHLENQMRAGGHQPGLAGFPDLRRGSRSVSRQKMAPQSCFGRSAHGDNCVVHHGARGGPHFRHLHPHILREVRRHGEVLIFDNALPGDLEGLRQLEDRIGLCDPPAIDEWLGRWCIRSVSGSGARIHPRDERFPLRGGEREVVGIAQHGGIGVPRRHSAGGHGFANRLRPRTRLLVGEQRHGGGLSGPVTTLTAFGQHG